MAVRLTNIEGDQSFGVVPLTMRDQPTALGSGVKVSVTIATLSLNTIWRTKDTPPLGSCTTVPFLSRTGFFLPLKLREIPDEDVSGVVENPVGCLTVTADR